MLTEHRCAGRARVLVVDDDLPLRFVLGLMLERAGYAPTAVASVDRALELLSALRTEAPDVPALAISGSGSDDDHSAGQSSWGAQTVLLKPVRPEVLYAAVETALAARATGCEARRGLSAAGAEARR